MRRILGTFAAAALVAMCALVAGSGPAHAVAPAPQCESGASRYFCIASSSGTTTWTITIFPGTPFTVTTPGSILNSSCSGGSSTSIFYSYVSGGVTETSSTRAFRCNAGPWP
jgi:hypothetical protein